MSQKKRKFSATKTRSGGNFREKKKDLSILTPHELVNPWNFYSLFNADDNIFCGWLRKQGLLATTLICVNRERGAHCGGLMTLKVRSERKGNQIFRCTKNRNHVKTMMAISFFEKTKLEIQDAMVFIKLYLDKNTLLQCANFSGICYKSIAVDWASYIREMFKEHFHRHIRQKVLGGIFEIDESLFGRRVKYHKGNPNKGMKVWIFGLVDREANTVILYPVSDRTKETLLPLIQRHVAPGSTIYSDGWSAYLDLNDMGYRHFTVLHKYTFRKDYIDVETGAKTTVHTNRIEGAWKHAKDHFRRIVGTKSGQFEGHLAEIMWRSEAKGDMYGRFFQLMRECWTLDKPVEYNYTTPLFDSWEGPPTAHQRDQVVPIESGAETSESEMGDAEQGPSHQPVARPIFHVGETETTVSSSDDEDTSLDRTITNTDVQPLRNSSASTSHQSTLSPEKLSTERYTTKVVTGETISTTSHQMLRQPTPQTSRLSIASPSSSAEQGANIKTTKKRPIKNKTKNVCHPVGFKEARSEQSKSHKHRRLTNDYKKSAFQWDFSDSEDDVFDYDTDKSRRKSSANSTKKQKDSAIKTDNVCCPRGFRQDKKEGHQLQRRNSNQYKKSAYVWNFSDSEEDDFV